MSCKKDDSRQLPIVFPRPCDEKLEKLQTEISGIKHTLDGIAYNLRILTVNVQTLQIAVDRLLKDN